MLECMTLGFVILALLTRRKKKVEKNVKALFDEQCGGAFNFWKATFPFVRHSIYDDFVVIAWLHKVYLIRFDEIEKAEIKFRGMFPGIFHHHRKMHIPSKLAVSTRWPEEISTILQNQGVVVTEK